MGSVGPGAMPGGRALLALVFANSVAEYAAWIAVLVVAYDEGGPPVAGLAVLVQLLPAALFAPVVAAAGDRFPRHRVVTAAFTVEATTAGGLAVALVADAPFAAVLALAAVFTLSTIATPATVASLLVHHARTPTQLVKWNVAQSSVRAGGSLSGPLLTAVVLAVAEPAAVFAGMGVCCAVAAVLAGLRLPHDDRLPATLSITSVLRDAGEGVYYVARQREPRRIVMFVGANEMLVGAVDLILVAVALDQLRRGNSVVALLSVAFAVGTFLAAALASRFLEWSLSRLITVGAAFSTLPLLAFGEMSMLTAVLALKVLLGIGSGLIDIGAQTLLQRSCAETMTSRAHGALDSTALIAGAAGAMITGRLIEQRDLGATLLALGVVGAVVLLGGSLRLRLTERSLPVADPALIASLRAVSFLASLPQPTLERLGRASQRRTVPAGTTVVVEGDEGHEFFVLLSGAAEVRTGDEVVGRLAAPDSFGEVALLHDDIRVATVTLTEPGQLAVIRREDFLEAISRTATSRRDALAVAEQYRRPTGAADPA